MEQKNTLNVALFKYLQLPVGLLVNVVENVVMVKMGCFVNNTQKNRKQVVIFGYRKRRTYNESTG